MDSVYSHDRYNKLIEDTFAEIKKLSALKGGEYAGDGDRLANFRRNGTDQDLPMETIWRVYAAKHWDAIGQYCKDRLKGKDRERLESITGRADDLITYLILFKAMVDERETVGSVDSDSSVPKRSHAPGSWEPVGTSYDVRRVLPSERGVLNLPQGGLR
jgi:hypothetical protein